MAEEKREVNFSETIKPDLIPIEGNKTEEIESENEKETPEPSSTPENQSEEKEEEKIEEPEKIESSEEKLPKPVEGETERERALRFETSRLRKQLRETRNQKIFEGYKPEIKDDLSDEEKATLSQYDEKELSQFEKVIDVVAKKKGWVKKGDFQATTYQQQASDILDSWLESHKEYLSENDKDNLLWGEFQHEFALYRKPENPRDLKRIFDKVHREVFGISQQSDNKLNAQKEKIKVASHQGANQRSQIIQSSKNSIDPKLREYLKGFDEEEKDEIIG